MIGISNNNNHLATNKEKYTHKVPILADLNSCYTQNSSTHNDNFDKYKTNFYSEIQNDQGERKNRQPSSPLLDTKIFQPLNPIKIDNDTAFGPSGYNFTGSGTKSDPFIIEGYNISGSSQRLIDISDTNAYFIIRDNILDGISGSKSCIYLWNVTHGLIDNNTIQNGYVGIVLNSNSQNNTVSNNLIESNSFNGVIISASSNNSILGNKIYNNSMSGIMMNGSSFNTLSGNAIAYQTDGISLSAWNNSILNNNIFNNSQDGCNLGGADNNTVSRNNIYNNTYLGISLFLSMENFIDRNNFINNYVGGGGLPQADDNNGSGNIFIYNHWADKTGPDNNSNGYVDSAYSISGSSGNSDPFPLVYPFAGYIPFIAISITDNAQFGGGGYNFPGSGTESDPYIIEGYNITDSSQILVTIRDTTVFFKIRGNFLNGLTKSFDCVRFQNVKNGVIENNVIQNGEEGVVFVDQVVNSTISDNDILNHFYFGIRVSATTSYNNTISGNYIQGNSMGGIAMNGSNFNTYSGNTITENDDGFFLLWASNNNLSNNLVYNNTNSGFYLSNAVYTDISNNSVYKNNFGLRIDNSGHHINISYNRIYNNSQYGIQMWQNLNHITIFRNNISYNGVSGIRIDSVTDSIVLNNKIDNNAQYGIFLMDSKNNNFTNNLICNNTDRGIQLNINCTNNNLYHNKIYYTNWGGIYLGSSTLNTLYNNSINKTIYGIYCDPNSNDNIIQKNFISNNTGYGIYLETCLDNRITYNLVNNNLGYGIYLHSTTSYNDIHWNSFFNNNPGNPQAYDDGTNNSFMYNYWDDHLGTDSNSDGYFDNPYNIAGGASEADSYPRVYPHIPRSRIYIDENADFGTFGFPGQGTKGSPYIIENYLIMYSSVSLIHISFTTEFFIIRNNWINGNGSSNGIVLDNVQNGYIDDNFIENSLNGIYMISSNDNTINNNKIRDSSQDGIVLSSASYNNNITCNTILFNNNTGIWLSNSPNNIIEENILFNNSNCGINLFLSLTNTIKRNVIYNNSRGIELTNSSFTTLSENAVNNNFPVGIFLYGAENNTITDNNVTGNYQGVVLQYSNNNSFSGNNASFNNYMGFSLSYGSNNTLNNNIISNNNYSGIVLVEMTFNTFIGNTISDHPNTTVVISNTTVTYGFGIWLYYQSSNNTISNNSIINNFNYGVFILFCDGNRIQYNEFINNNLNGTKDGTSQAFDNGTYNIFVNNYWNDWTSPDIDSDGIVDDSYAIDGFANNSDLFPLTTALHSLSSPIIIFPNGGETINGTVLLLWEPSIDNQNHSVTYDLYYSSDGGSNWVPLASNLINTNFSWDTWTVLNGTNYLIQVNATCSAGLWQFDVSDNTFTIYNIPNKAPVVTVIDPNGNKTIQGIHEIIWTASDPEGEILSFDIFYWNGESWIAIEVNHTQFSLYWDTRNLIDRSDYKIRVNASDGLNVATDDSDDFFRIDNDPSFEQIPEGESVIVIDGIVLEFNVSESVNVTTRLVTPEEVPPLPSILDSLDIYLDITVSNPDALIGLWINISFDKLGGRDPTYVKIFYYSADLRWEEVMKTGVDKDREVVWGWTDHLTLFGVLDIGSDVPDNIFQVLLLALFFITAVGLSAFFLYRRVKKQRLKREIGERIRKLTDRETRRPQIDIDLLMRDLDDED